ncbi:uncharacterized protein [Hyperolius riggenbachi]|uniref:uncharacterized protein n=1 Tax=Hyperolius riggenbachi TaxID=752182 RepID=UPI0035A2D9B0
MSTTSCAILLIVKARSCAGKLRQSLDPGWVIVAGALRTSALHGIPGGYDVDLPQTSSASEGGEGASGSTGAFVEHRHATTHLAEGESDVAATTGESAGDSAAEYLQSQDDIPESVEGASGAAEYTGESAVDSAAEYRQGQDDIPESVEGASGAAENTGDIGEDQHVVLLLEPILEQEVSDLRTSADVCTMEHEECEAGEFVLHMSDESHTTELLSSPTSETFTATNVPSRPSYQSHEELSREAYNSDRCHSVTAIPQSTI